MHVPLFAEQPLAAAAPLFVGEEVVEAGHDRFAGQARVVVEIELGLQVVGELAGDEGGVGPGLAVDAAGADLGRGRLGDDGGADGHAPVRGAGHPDGRHGVAVPARVGDHLDDQAGRVPVGRLVVVAHGLAFQGAARVGVGHGHPCHVPGPGALEIDALFRHRFTVAGPARFAVRIDEHVGEDDLGAGLAQTLHQVGVAFLVDVGDDAEDADLRVDRPQGAIVTDPHLGEVVADEIAAHHGRGGLAAARGCGTGEVGGAAVRAGHAGDEHVLGQFLAVVPVDGRVRGEAVVALLHQERVAGIGAEGGEGGLPAAVHVDAGLGDVLGAVGSLGVDVGEELAAAGDLGVEVGEAVAVEEFRRVEHVGGTGDLDGRDGGPGPHRAAAVEADEHGHAAHDAAHVLAHVGVGLVAQFLLGQRGHLLVRVGDVEGLVDHAALVLGQVEVDGVAGHGELGLLAFFQAQGPHRGAVRLAAGKDEHPLRVAHGDGVGDLEQRLLVGDRAQPGEMLRVEPSGEQLPCLGDGGNPANRRQDINAFSEIQHPASVGCPPFDKRKEEKLPRGSCLQMNDHALFISSLFTNRQTGIVLLWVFQRTCDRAAGLSRSRAGR